MLASLGRTLSFAVWLALAGCSVFDPSLVEERDGGPVPADGPIADAPPEDVPVVLGRGCTEPSRLPPTRPSADTAGEDGPEVVWVLREIDLQQGNDWMNIGFDLDNSCTSNILNGSCQPPNDGDPVLDGPFGLDNTFGEEIYPLVEDLDPGLEMSARDSQDSGLGAIVMRVRGWNGTANDNLVEVMLSQTVVGAPYTEGVEEPPPMETNDEFQGHPPGEPENRYIPTYDGNDWFWLRTDAFVANDLERPKLYDDAAYMRDGVLVFSLPDRAEIIFTSTTAGVAVRLTDSTATAQLSADLSRPELVTMAGRWSINDLLDTARALGVCDEDTEFRIFQRALDRHADVRSDPDDSEDLACNAISLGVTLVGYRARIAGMTDGPVLPNLCL